MKIKNKTTTFQLNALKLITPTKQIKSNSLKRKEFLIFLNNSSQPSCRFSVNNVLRKHSYVFLPSIIIPIKSIMHHTIKGFVYNINGYSPSNVEIMHDNNAMPPSIYI